MENPEGGPLEPMQAGMWGPKLRVMSTVIVLRFVPPEAYEVNGLTPCVSYVEISRNEPENSDGQTTITESLD